MIIRILWRIGLLLLILPQGEVYAANREGDTLEPVTISAPPLTTWPENLLDEEGEFNPILARVREARNSGVPLAVRVVDLSLPNQELPLPMRQFAEDDFSAPLTAERRDQIAGAWIRSEQIETSEGANDGFLLLVLVPEDRSQTQAIWWIGPDALPLNGLTESNILATHDVMNFQFSQGAVASGTFLGVSEFSYNIQFGRPERLERTRLQEALHTATLPLAVVTALAGVSIPALAWWLSRQRHQITVKNHSLTPWEAAALHEGRARATIPTGMLLDAIKGGEISHHTDGGLQILDSSDNMAVEALRPFADERGVISTTAMYEIEAIQEPVRDEIERRLAATGAMTPHAKRDRSWMLGATGLAAFLMALGVVPSVISMSAPGIYGIAIAAVGIGIGWWWLASRRYTTPAGERLLHAWLHDATPEQLATFDSVVHLDSLADSPFGPDGPEDTRHLRRLRGPGSA